MIRLVCCNCDKEFERRIHDHNYNTKLGRRIFCSHKCSNEKQRKEKTERIRSVTVKNPGAVLKKYRKLNPYDKLEVAFTFMIRKARNRKDKVVDVTVEDLKEQWYNQEGVCAYSGLKLQLPSAHKRNCRLMTASLDRIESDKGYEVGNVQFISVMANTAKGISSHKDMIKFCKAIKSNRNI